jgi:hypothetical protein
MNLDFPFGAIEERWGRSFEHADWVSTEDVITQTYSGLVPTAGVLWLFEDKGAIGASYSHEVKLDRSTDLETQSGWSVSQDGGTALPAKLTVGATYRFHRQLTISAEISHELWERAYQDQPGYRNVTEVGLGGAYLPIREAKTPYYQRISVYVGGYTRSLYHDTGQPPKAVRERFLTFGFGLPFTQDQGALNLAFEFGTRGKLSDNGAEELVYRQSIAFSGWEKWFQRD